MRTIIKLMLLALAAYWLLAHGGRPQGNHDDSASTHNAFEALFASDLSDPSALAAALRSELCDDGDGCFAALRAAAQLQHRNPAHVRLCGDAAAAAAAPPPARGRRVMVALNLHNSAAVAPHSLRQLLALAAAHERGALFVSIFESGSTDATPAYLELLAAALSRCGVPHRILAGSALRLAKGFSGSRIEFMATIRNLALEPLWGGAAALDTSPAFVSNVTALGRAVPADRVVFINDVFWCMRHVLRLLAYDADLACGMDFYVLDFFEVRTFYDSWVSRSIDGAAVDGRPPYVPHRQSAALLAQGRPAPVRCCWNGLAVLKPGPFLEGVRFRDHAPGECAASECSILCDDLWRRNRTDFVMDPAVALAYDLADAVALARDPRLSQSFWRVTDSEAGYRHALRAQHPDPATTCCDLGPGRMHVDMATDCRTVGPLFGGEGGSAVQLPAPPDAAALLAQQNKSEM